ncbi:MAG: L,D-transpeptidase family protein, partial [Chitinophagaceae bacterium]
MMMLACNASSNGSSKTLTDTLPPPIQDVSIPGNFSDQTTLILDSVSLPQFIKSFPELRPYQKEMEQFYQGRSYSYAWFDEKGMIEQAGNLYNKLNNLHEEGIAASMPAATVFRKLMESDTLITNQKEESIVLELMLTAQYFFYAKHVWTGLGDKAMQEVKWNLPRKKLSYPLLLDSLLKSSSTAFQQTVPVHKQYLLLKEALKKYRSIEEKGGWPIVAWSKKSYAPGDSSRDIQLLRNRLWWSADFLYKNELPVYEETLIQAVKNFQRRHGLLEDGIAGKKVLEALNVPVSERIKQIIVNMERCRWLPPSVAGNYFMINIPSFTFYAYENDSVAWSMKVVVGKAIHQTAIFNGKLQYVVFSPYWNIPQSIMAKEILPAMRRNRNYLSAHNMEWNGNQIRQKPGADNALGLVKFIFPNSHNMYLHDTPAKTLF